MIHYEEITALITISYILPLILLALFIRFFCVPFFKNAKLEINKIRKFSGPEYPTLPKFIPPSNLIPFPPTNKENPDIKKALTIYQKGPAYLEYTIEDTFENIIILGSPGSGKTACSGAYFSHKYMQYGYGGIVFTYKSGETTKEGGGELKRWEALAKSTNRENDLIIFSPENKNTRINFLQYLSENLYEESTVPKNATEIIYAVIKELNSNGTLKTEEKFWEDTTKELIYHSLNLLWLSNKEISLDGLYELLKLAPKSLKEIEAPKKQNINHPIYKPIHKAEDNLEPSKKRSLKFTKDYWTEDFPEMPEKTRACIIRTLKSMLNLFTDTFHDLLLVENTIDLTDTFKGKVFIIDLPISSGWRKEGQAVQILIKRLYQEIVKNRNTAKSTRPLFMWIDEASHFITEEDADFLSHSRDKRMSVVHIAQNFGQYIKRLNYNQNAADEYLAQFQTTIIHRTNDNATSKWISDKIGNQFETIESTTESANKTYSTSHGTSTNINYSPFPSNQSKGVNDSESYSLSEGNSITRSIQLHPILPTAQVTRLKKAKETKDGHAETIVITPRLWPDGSIHKKVTFWPFSIESPKIREPEIDNTDYIKHLELENRSKQHSLVLQWENQVKESKKETEEKVAEKRVEKTLVFIFFIAIFCFVLYATHYITEPIFYPLKEEIITRSTTPYPEHLQRISPHRACDILNKYSTYQPEKMSPEKPLLKIEDEEATFSSPYACIGYFYGLQIDVVFHSELTFTSGMSV